MNKEKAIESLIWIKENLVISEDFKEALDIAVKALHQEPKNGEWEDIGGVIRYGCPFCHHAQEEKSEYCPNCGAKMDKGGEDE